MTSQLTAAEAARRLGVKPATLYAYVSRGTLSRQRSADGRTSLFDAEEIERLARRGRPRRPAGALDITVESRITQISGDRLRYRGHDAIGLARDRPFEDVAELLWGAENTVLPKGGFAPFSNPPDRGAARPPGPPGRPTAESAAGRDGDLRSPWRAPDAALETARAAGAVLPPGVRPLERMQVIVPVMAVTDPLRLRLDRPAVMAAGRAIAAGMVDCLPPAGPGNGGEEGAIAARLWTRVCDRRPSRPMLRALSSALVLMADHELAVSTLAARTAASARADPYAVVSAGLGAVSGALHGGASLAVEAMLSAAREPGDVPRVVADLLRQGERVPGFGHSVYRGEDPRFTLLLSLVREAAPRSRALAVADAVVAEAGRRSLPRPNVDLALGTLAVAAGMTRGAGEAVFAVARTAGWLAHAMEAYETGKILRPRASYTGPAADGR